MFQTIIGDDLKTCKELLEHGEVVAVPTETVYGLAANALDPIAVLKIFETKNRPHFDPLIVHLKSVSEVDQYVLSIPANAKKLMTAFSPGPITFLLPKKKLIPDIVTSGLNTVAIRIPAHPLFKKLLNTIDFPLAAPSANPFGYISPTTSLHVYEQLQGKIHYILEGGPAIVGVESTIVGFEENQVIVYRPGGISNEAIESVVGKIIVNNTESSKPLSPGQLKSHYAPTKPLVIYKEGMVMQNNAAVIGYDQYIEGVNPEHQFLLSPTGDLQEAASKLFAVMRQLDQSNYSTIYAIHFPDNGLGIAINDRLQRAAVGSSEE